LLPPLHPLFLQHQSAHAAADLHQHQAEHQHQHPHQWWSCVPFGLQLLCLQQWLCLGVWVCWCCCARVLQD
jgi:hypothetical protein